MTQHLSPTRPLLTKRRLRGFTLIELMVAMALGLLLLGALVSLVVSTISTRTELDKNSRQIENGRYALEVLSDDIESAGFIGATGLQSWARHALATPCTNTIADLGYTSGATPKLPLAIQALGTDLACLESAKEKTGVLVVTRASSTETATTSASATEAYLQVSTCQSDVSRLVVANGGSADFVLKQKDCDSAKPAPLRKAIQRIYFVSTCNDCTKNDGIPTLKMIDYVGGARVITPLVDGIDNLQFDFGVDTDGNGSPDCYVSNPTSPDPLQISATACPPPATAYDWTKSEANWVNTMAVRIHVLARNTEPTTGWKDDRTYNLGLSTNIAAPNDGFKRHVYSTVARLNNPSGLKELP